MRPAFHLGLIGALLISFSRAPYEHFHPGDLDHLHSHHFEADDHDDDELSLEVPDHDSGAEFKDWLAGDGSTPQKNRCEAPQAAVLPTLITLERTGLAVRPCSHDPPALARHFGRAPPSIIYL